jgi:phosphoserine phosphatase
VAVAGRAFDIPIAGDGASGARRARSLATNADINLVATAQRRKKLLVADMDSTIIGCECLDELADMAGLKAKVSAITERAMRGEIEFAGALARARGVAQGLAADALEKTYPNA